MQQQQGQTPSIFEEIKQYYAYTVGCSQILSKPLSVWLRMPGTWGDRHANYQMVLGFIAMWLFGPLFFGRHSQQGMTVFCFLTTALLPVHRVAGLWNWRAVAKTHSRYTGTSWFRGDDKRSKIILEPLLLFCIGLIVIAFSLPLGAYLLLAGIATALNASWQVGAERARIRSIRDSQIEQAWLMEEMKKREQNLGSR